MKPSTKTVLSIVVVVLAAVAVVFLLRAKRASAPVNPDQNPGVATPTEMITRQATSVDVAEDSFLLGISGSYPQFPQADAAFNAKIAKQVTDSIAEFKKSAQADYDVRLEMDGDAFSEQFAKGVPSYDYAVKYDVVQSNDSVISFTLYQEGYAGGAHGWHVTSSYNYDVKAKKDLSITDFMTLQEASDASRASLKQQFAEKGDVTTFDGFAIDGTDPSKPENFNVFTFTDKIVTVYFNEYQVAPYAYGAFEVEIPRK